LRASCEIYLKYRKPVSIQRFFKLRPAVPWNETGQNLPTGSVWQDILQPEYILIFLDRLILFAVKMSISAKKM